jgi:hypothetical protein
MDSVIWQTTHIGANFTVANALAISPAAVRVSVLVGVAAHGIRLAALDAIGSKPALGG